MTSDGDETDETTELFAERAEGVMRWLELGAAYFLVALFAIGVFDLGLSLVELFTSGRFVDPDAVIDLIDTVLVLLIIVEVFQTVIAFARDEPVIRIVINAALIAIARKIISFRFSEFDNNYQEALTASASLALLLGVIVAAFYVVRKTDPRPAGYTELLKGNVGDRGADDGGDGGGPLS